ncbi:MAG: DUF459 domain-containing protein [Alphaproteobacteria bacterium]|nr:DUF459 domain-containing protein [Alphaproteobacteria bacterium]MBV9555377.1 DUF459 domain-containing protein [Alphaproteobacteria bacterium]
MFAIGWLSLWRCVRSGGIAATLLFCFVCAAAAFADEDATVQRLVVFGDSQAQGIAGGLQRVMIDDARYRVLNRTHPGAAIVHSDSEWLAPIQNFLGREKADIAVVMFGANDRLDMRDEDGHYLHFRTDEWRAGYAKRIDKILAALAAGGIKMIWCGNPIARSATYTADMGYINDIYAGEVAHYGGAFLPLWTLIADPQGQFTAYGPDRNGVTERLRNDDGIHFTAAGYELIAERVVSMLPSLQANGR